MRCLLDTTALSEWSKPEPNSGYVRWSQIQKPDGAFIGAPSVGELYYGLDLTPNSRRRAAIATWLERLLAGFEARILPFDAECAQIWGIACGAARKRGRRLSIVASQLAAIAYVNGLTVVTRNTGDFDIPEFEKLKVISPWS